MEEAFAALDKLTGEMEQGSLSLEETFALYKQGLELIELCNNKIEKVESDIRILNEKGGLNE